MAGYYEEGPNYFPLMIQKGKFGRWLMPLKKLTQSPEARKKGEARVRLYE